MNRNVVRVLAILCSMTMIIGLVAGCGNSGNDQTTQKDSSTENEVAQDDSGTENEVAQDDSGTEDGTEQEEETGTGEVEVAVEQWEIPVLSAVTGPIAYVGKPASWSAEYAAKIINEQGGINGVPVKVNIMDTKFDTAEVASCLSQVIDKSLVIVGPMDAPGGEVAGQMIFDASLPNIAAYSYEDSRTAYAPYAIAYMTDSEEGDVIAAKKWIELNPDIKKVVLFACPSDASQVAITELLEEFLPTIDVEVAGVVEVETDTLDCGPAAVQALNYGADGYLSVLRADENAKVVSELRTRGVEEGRRITSGFSSYSDNYISVAGASALDGTYIWNKLDPNYDGDEWNTLVAAYQADFDGASPISNPVPDFYNALMAIKTCYEELGITGNPDLAEAEKTAIAEWFYNSPTIHGIQGDFTWEKGKKIMDVYYFQFEGDSPASVE